MSTNITEIIKEELSADGAAGARVLARSLIKKAEEGNASIAKLIFDRIDGPIEKTDREPLDEEERVERIVVILDSARERRDRRASRR